MRRGMSSFLSRRGGITMGRTLILKNKSSRNRLALTKGAKLTWLVAMIRTSTGIGSFFQQVKEFYLEKRVDFTNFIQKEGPSISEKDLSFFITGSLRKGPLNVTE